MLNMIAMALAAAQPAAPAQSADTHAQHQQMGHQPGAMKPGMIAGMKDCCCKDKMAKMKGEHANQAQPDQHQNHKQ